jgi:short-subunit dehydrogenase
MSGKALITGASSGIGATYADRLAERGYDLILVARNAQRLEAAAAELTGRYGVSVEIFPADLGDAAALARAEGVLRTDQDISFLVNNAGISGGKPFIGADPDLLESIVRLNVVALTRLAAAAADSFARRGKGTIVNIGSVTALMPEDFEPTYSATKAYVLAFSQGIAGDLASHGVTVQAVLPGATRTEIWEKSGLNIDDFPQDSIMEVGDMVDAALAGLDAGERVTIPSLPFVSAWNSLESARHALRPNLSRRLPAQRYVEPELTLA